MHAAEQRSAMFLALLSHRTVTAASFSVSASIVS
jgi:hypothetical protein